MPTQKPRFNIADVVNGILIDVGEVLAERKEDRYFEEIVLIYSTIENVLKWLIFLKVMWGRHAPQFSEPAVESNRKSIQARCTSRKQPSAKKKVGRTWQHLRWFDSFDEWISKRDREWGSPLHQIIDSSWLTVPNTGGQRLCRSPRWWFTRNGAIMWRVSPTRRCRWTTPFGGNLQRKILSIEELNTLIFPAISNHLFNNGDKNETKSREKGETNERHCSPKSIQDGDI